MKEIHLQSERKLLKILLQYDFDRISIKFLKFPEFLRVNSDEVNVTHVEEPLSVVSGARPGFMWNSRSYSHFPVICIPGSKRQRDHRQFSARYTESRFNKIVESLSKLVEKCSKKET